MRRLPALLAAGYGAYLLYAYASGALYFYIHPLYIGPAVAAALLLLSLALATAGPPPGHHVPRPRTASLALLALPLVLGFGLPARPLGALAAAQRGVEVGTLDGTPGRGDPEPAFRPGARPEAYSIKDWVKAFQAEPEPARHAGQPAGVTGFVHRDGRLPPDWFVVARFVVACCAVDAQPVGLPVRWPEAARPPAGQWVRVEGIWEVAEVGGVRRAVIAPGSVVPATRPEQPYLY